MYFVLPNFQVLQSVLIELMCDILFFLVHVALRNPLFGKAEIFKFTNSIAFFVRKHLPIFVRDAILAFLRVL